MLKLGKSETMEKCNYCHSQNHFCKDSVPRLSTNGQLSLAIQNRNEVWVKSLLKFPDKDFDVLKGNYICQAAESGHVGILLELLAAGADPNEQSVYCLKRPVHICTAAGHLEALKALVSHGANVNKLDGHKRTPMHFAAQQGHEGLIKWLVDHGTLADEVESDGYSPLHVASCLGYKAVCKSLLTVGEAEINRRTEDGWSSLHMAVSYGHLEIVKMFFAFGADPEEKTAEGETALHMACAKGFTEIVQVLLNHGVDVESSTRRGATPLHYAMYYGHQNVVYNLLKSGASINFLNLPATSCPLNQAAVRGDQDMLCLLWSAGCIVSRNIAVLMHSRKNITAENRDDISRFPSLRDLSVWKVRLLLSPDLQSKALLLPLPAILKNIVAFHHLKIS